MQHGECFGVIGWWVALFLAMWAALYVYGKNRAQDSILQFLARLGGGSALLVGLLVFFAAFIHEIVLCDCTHAWWHVVGSLSATALIAGPIMLVAPRLQRG